MSRKNFKYWLAFASMCLFGTIGYAQSQRSLNNDGVEQFNQKKFNDSEINFRKGIEKDSSASVPYFNLGDAYYKQKKYEDALKAYQTALSKTKDKDLKGKAYYNIGNTLLDGNQLKESIEAYKNSLKMNPKDEDAKYNLSYAIKKLREEENKQKQQNKQNDKNKDDKKDKSKDKQNDKQNKDNKGQKQNEKQNQQDQNKDKQDQQKQQQQRQQPKMSKEQAQQILNALKDNEKDMQKKLRKKVGERVKVEKDW